MIYIYIYITYTSHVTCIFLEPDQLRLLGVLGWGLWIVGLGLPALGWSFCIIAIAPGWPYALYDLMHLGYKQAPKSRRYADGLRL